MKSGAVVSQFLCFLEKHSKRNASQQAVRPDLVVVLTALSNLLANLVYRLEPLFVEAFIAELAVEALDVAVLHGPAELNPAVSHRSHLYKPEPCGGWGLGRCRFKRQADSHETP